MQRISLPAMFGCWIIILVIELFSFYGMRYDRDDAVFYVTLIAVTLVVGAVGLAIASKIDRDGNRMTRL